MGHDSIKWLVFSYDILVMLTTPLHEGSVTNGPKAAILFIVINYNLFGPEPVIYNIAHSY